MSVWPPPTPKDKFDPIELETAKQYAADLRKCEVMDYADTERRCRDLADELDALSRRLRLRQGYLMATQNKA